MEEKVVSLDDALNLAMGHMSNSNYRVAEMVLQDILKVVPEHPSTHYLMGICRYYMRDLEGALSYMKTAVESDEDVEAEWFTNYGVFLTEAKRLEEATAAFENAVKLDPDYVEGYWNMSHTYWLMGQYEKAEASARQCIEIKDDIPEAWLNLGAALVSQDKKEEAIEAWEKALEINPDFALAWNNIGNAMRDTGRLEASVESCRKALELMPDYPEALNNLGNALMDMGDLEESEEAYRKAVSGRPEYVEAHSNLAINLIKQNRYEEAIQSARVALSYRKNYNQALLSLSLACRSIGDLDEAEKAVQEAVVLNPDSAEAHLDMADLLFMRDRYADAEIEIERARALEPDTPRVYLKLADVLERGNKVEEALEAIDKAVELNPEMPEAFWKKGNICHIANRVPEAEEFFKKALEIRPNSAGVHISLAELALTKGEMDVAREEVEKARKLSSNSPALFLTLSRVKKFTEDDEDFQKMLELEEKISERGVDHSSHLNYALFTAFEHIGNYDKAFEHLLKASTFKRKTIPYNAEQQKHNFEAVRKIYSKDELAQYEGKGFDSDIPVFILGMPRSGTTLTEQIISSHADVYGAGELSQMTQMEMEFGLLTLDNAKKQGEWYVDQVKALDTSGKALRVTDKMPGNFAHMGRIVSVLPGAKIIHTRRNPIDTCLSCFKQNFARGQYWSYDLKELGSYYNEYLDMMAYWREVIPEKFIEVDYETTVNDFEPQARKLIDHVDLPWDDACLEPHKQKRAVLTASKQQVTKPIYKTSVKAWKRYEKQLEPLIDELQSGPAKELLDL